MRKLATLALITLCSTSVFAADGNKTIFSCTDTNGKAVTIKKAGGNYSFSHNGVTVKNSVNQVLNNPNSLIASRSGYILETLEFTGENKNYYVQYKEEIGEQATPLFAGVFEGDGESEPHLIAECNLKKKLVTKFEYKIMKQSGTGF